MNVTLKAEDSYNYIVKICVSYLNTLPPDGPHIEPATAWINMHMNAIREALITDRTPNTIEDSEVNSSEVNE